jgi:hypothetical protein
MLLRLPPRSRTERLLDSIECRPRASFWLAVVASAAVWSIALATAWEQLSYR